MVSSLYCKHGLIRDFCSPCLAEERRKGTIQIPAVPTRRGASRRGESMSTTEDGRQRRVRPGTAAQVVVASDNKENAPFLDEDARAFKERLGEIPHGTEIHVPVEYIGRFVGQPRKFFRQSSLESLAMSLTQVQNKPIEVRWLPHDPRLFCELVDGERRLRAALIAGLPTLRALVVGIVDEKDQYARSFMANFGHEGHTPLEIADAIDRLLNDDWDVLQIANAFGKKEQWIKNSHRLVRLAPDVRIMMDPSLPTNKRITLLVAAQLVPLNPRFQVLLAKQVIEGGMSTNIARAHIRREATKAGQKAGYRRRSPTKDYGVLQGSVNSMHERMALFLAMQPSEVESIFEHRNPDDRAQMAKDLRKIGSDIGRFVDRFLEPKEVNS